MNSNNQQKEKKSSRWKDQNHYERHYCEICNVWMGSDRASILMHENGKKHKENVKIYEKKRIQETAKQEKQNEFLKKSLQQMEMAAHTSFIQNDYNRFATTSTTTTTLQQQVPQHVTSFATQQPPPPPPPVVTSTAPPLINKEDEKKEWEKRKREKIQQSKKNNDEEKQDQDTEIQQNSNKRIKIEKDQGYYEQQIDENLKKTWLEGIVFGDILEIDMPIQIWLGSTMNVSDSELKLAMNQRYWKDAIIIKIIKRKEYTNHSDRMVIDVSYLNDDNNNEEIIKKSIPLQFIRILLGNTHDTRIPETVEEARLLAMGGEETVVVKDNETNVDETTGLSGWSTVQIKRTTVRNELKEERERIHAKRKQDAIEKEKQIEQLKQRKMEEAKIANADDSALGAYDIWNQSNNNYGYKGINIHHDDNNNNTTTPSVQEFGKKLATDGKPVTFKKKIIKKKGNRRTTSADD